MEVFRKRFPIDKEWDWMGVPQDKELCNAMLETGWRAALKWVLRHPNVKDLMYDDVDGEEGLFDFIKKELEK